jgi:ribosomal-protein-alanine N-acetyltransferase
LRIRRANNADVPAMIALGNQSPGAAHWSPQQYEALFASGRLPTQRFAWVVEEEAGAQPETVAGEASATLGFLVAHKIDAEWELENIVVAETARRQGMGKHLLGELIACARVERSREIFLEVRKSNHAARALYRCAGFEETGLRKSYYSDPSEDAILYRLSLY